MSVKMGPVERRFFMMAKLFLTQHEKYIAFNEFALKPRYINSLDMDYIERYKKKYKYLYSHPRDFILFNPFAFNTWYNDKLHLISKLLYLPQDIIAYIMDKEKYG